MLDNIIPPEIKNDRFYDAIIRFAEQETVRTVLEIGSSAGNGSTEAFVKGLKRNTKNPSLYCLEISKPRFSELLKRYASEEFVKCYNLSSVALDKFPTEDDIKEF
jgi:phospholipid N-methyltransferase